ncbi:hypothetical protein CROQUDRAFT_41121, partial [Cronartium quercuum f. sp. fusiforme G11]
DLGMSSKNSVQAFLTSQDSRMRQKQTRWGIEIRWTSTRNWLTTITRIFKDDKEGRLVRWSNNYILNKVRVSKISS